jgi:ribosomal protein S18 acetylase RimI-like enzyme
LSCSGEPCVVQVKVVGKASLFRSSCASLRDLWAGGAEGPVRTVVLVEPAPDGQVDVSFEIGSLLEDGAEHRRGLDTLTSVTSTTVADYAAAFQRHAASLLPAGHRLIDHDGLLGFAGTPAWPDARLLVTDDKALSLLHEMLFSVSAGTIKVLDTAPGCRALLDQTPSWVRDSVTAMVCLDLNAVPDLPIPDGLTFHPVRRSPTDETDGTALTHAAAAYLHAQAAATTTAPLDQFISYLRSLPDRVRLFAAVDGSGVVQATSASEATDEDARVFFVSTHPSCRGRGIGTAMTAAALHDAARSGSRKASLESTHAGIGIYTRLTFEPVSAVSVYHR